MRRLSSYENYTLDYARAEVWESTRAAALLRKAIRAEKAHEVAPQKWELHWQMNCQTPVYRHYVSRGDTYSGKVRKPLSIVSAVRCRKCEGCMDSKARLWASKACGEFRTWPHTLMATFTTSPAIDAQFDALVARRCDMSKLSSDELFVERASEFQAELQKWAKRVRSAVEYRCGETGVMRYLMVAERHKNDSVKRGLPHFHGLIYETKSGTLIQGDPVAALRDMTQNGEYVGKYYQDSNGSWKKGVFLTDESLLRQQWKLGWNKFQVAFDELSVFYVLKYMSKEGIYRVFPSELFGDDEYLSSQTKTDQEIDPALADLSVDASNRPKS